jgi:ligand-binding sensor domain-containing protein
MTYGAGVTALRGLGIRFYDPRALNVPFLCLALSHFVTVSSAVTTKEVRHYALTTWRTDQGLPQNFITAIEQTPDGFLWIGTLGGLARFDGLHFTTFSGGDDCFSLQDRTTGLAIDRDGSLWIASSSGLSHYANGKFTQVANQAGAQRYAAGDLLADLGRWSVGGDVRRSFSRGWAWVPCLLYFRCERDRGRHGPDALGRKQ